MNQLLVAVVSGVVGGFFGPLAYSEYQSWKREKKWAKPRKELLLRMLKDEKYRFKSIDRLARTTGCSHDECRTLLIELGARGARMKSGTEMWALISRAPLKEDLRQISDDEEEAE